MHIYEVLRRPVITEKNTDLMTQNKYVFEVMKSANKDQVKAAVEKAFKVRVVSVNTVMVPSKPRGYGRLKGQRSSWKKAIVTLMEGDKIEIFEGV
ncbi:50S ribosomal protein L23 [Dehalococcoidia bacterium]|nr:50S ribosomal protein L23 [Dehalococcoidia bacterium]